jgi:hypothetical protein
MCLEPLSRIRLDIVAKICCWGFLLISVPHSKGPIWITFRSARAWIFNATKGKGRSTPAYRPIRHVGSNEANCIVMQLVVHELYIDLYEIL